MGLVYSSGEWEKDLVELYGNRDEGRPPLMVLMQQLEARDLSEQFGSQLTVEINRLLNSIEDLQDG